MAGIQQVTGTAVALERRDVDTDQIIPAAWLKRVERTGFGPGLFGAWRENPDFVLNRPGADQAKVLVAGTNFGCGSSREHAVWALQDFGFQAVVSARFADIFRGNCISSGLVPVEIDEKIITMLFDALRDDPAATVVVDVAGRTIGIPSADISEPFGLADFAQWRLLEGLDDVALTLRYEDAITAFEGGRPGWLPAVTPNAPTSA
jgi:3-isopropylmalate/(R)-2-methylmalate dehydratase small subunit